MARLHGRRQRAGAPAVVDPGAGRLTRFVLTVGRWQLPVRWFLGVTAVVAALQLVPYATWQGPAPSWATGVFAWASALWLLLPGAVSLVQRRSVISTGTLRGHSDAAALLTVACNAQERFDVAIDCLGEPQRWVTDARGRIGHTAWLVALRAREISALEAALRRNRSTSDGPFRHAEEQRLLDEIAIHQEAARDMAGELVRLADVTERTALTVSQHPAASTSGLSGDERASLEALQWFRVRLEAVEEAWLELGDAGGVCGWCGGGSDQSLAENLLKGWSGASDT